MRINLVGCQDKDGQLITHDARYYCELCRLPDDLHARLLAAERLAEAAESLRKWSRDEYQNNAEIDAAFDAALLAWREASK